MTAPPAQPGTALTHHRRPGLLLATLVGTGLVVSLVSTLGVPLVPVIAEEFGTSVGDAQWTFTITMLVGVMATPVVGRLGDTAHAREAMLATVGIVVLGGAVCAVSPNLPVLLAGRALQGVCLGIIPMAVAIAREQMPPHRLRPAVAMLSVTVVTGSGLGYPAIGAVTDRWGWRAAFLLATGLSAAALASVALALDRVPTAESRARLPLLEAGILATGLALALLTVSQSSVWPLSATLACAVGGVALITSWGTISLRSPTPVIDLRLTTHRSVMGANTAALFLGIGMYVATSLAIHIAQAPADEAGLGADVTRSGLLILPLSLASLAANRLARFWGGRRSPLVGLVAAMAVVTASLLVLAFARGSLAQLAVAMTVLGAGLGVCFALMPFLVLENVPAGETGGAMSLNMVLRHLGGAVGSAGGVALVALGGADLDAGYRIAFLTIGALCALATLLVAGLGRARVGVRRRPPPDVLVLASADGGGEAVVVRREGPDRPAGHPDPTALPQAPHSRFPGSPPMLGP